MNKTINSETLSHLVNKMVDNKNIFSTVMKVENSEGDVSWSGAAGGFPPPGLFFFGIGLEKLRIPWLVSPFKHPGDILGFWGQTGSFAFYNPKTDLYFCGTTNQINGKGHRAATSTMLKVIKSVL